MGSGKQEVVALKESSVRGKMLPKFPQKRTPKDGGT